MEVKAGASTQKIKILIISVDQETYDRIIEKIPLIFKEKGYNEVIIVITDPLFSEDFKKTDQITELIEKQSGLHKNYIKTIAVADPWETPGLRGRIKKDIVERIDKLYLWRSEKGAGNFSSFRTNVEVIINFTGGNRIVNFLLLSEFLGWIRENLTVKFECHGDEGKYFLEDKIYHQWTLEQIYDEIHHCKYAEASDLSRYLPEVPYFWVHLLTEGLVKWDNFEYQEARKNFTKLIEWINVRETEHDLYQAEKFCINLIKTLLELTKEWESFLSLLRLFNELRKKNHISVDEVKNKIDYFLFLLVDMVVKSEIQYINERYAECLVRGYRACEMATQIKLIENDINPWNFDCELFKKNFLDAERRVEEFQKIISSTKKFERFKLAIPNTDKLALFDSIPVLYVVDRNFSQNIEKIMNSIQTIAHRRNSLFLTHGFLTYTKEAHPKKEEKDVLEDVKEAIFLILGSELKEKFERYYKTLHSAFIDEELFEKKQN
jgi:hypothetical protein